MVYSICIQHERPLCMQPRSKWFVLVHHIAMFAHALGPMVYQFLFPEVKKYKK